MKLHEEEAEEESSTPAPAEVPETIEAPAGDDSPHHASRPSVVNTSLVAYTISYPALPFFLDIYSYSIFCGFLGGGWRLLGNIQWNILYILRDCIFCSAVI